MTVKSKRLTTSVHPAVRSKAFSLTFNTNGKNYAHPTARVEKTELKSRKPIKSDYIGQTKSTRTKKTIKQLFIIVR